jgi:[protein-PII] uridylyltransferase
VDEHTLLTIRNLERIAHTDQPYRLRFRNVINSVSRPELLVLALLLHDVGKWRDDDHALESERMAKGRRRSSATRRRCTGDGAVPDQAPPAHVARGIPS